MNVVLMTNYHGYATQCQYAHNMEPIQFVQCSGTFSELCGVLGHGTLVSYVSACSVLSGLLPVSVFPAL